MAKLFGKDPGQALGGRGSLCMFVVSLLLLSRCRSPDKPDRRVNAATQAAVHSVTAKDSQMAGARGLDGGLAGVHNGSRIHIPAGEPKPPFILVLHPLGGSGEQIERDLGLASFARLRRFAYSAPDAASTDSQGRRVWNAGVCCNFTQPETDDVGRLIGIIREAVSDFGVDARRVFVVGYSNGGFMAHRLACEHAGSIRAIVSMAAAGPAGQSTCTPAKAVAVLELHGDRDTVVPYTGGHLFGRPDLPSTPNVEKSLEPWVRVDKCEGPLRFSRRLDLIPALPGQETLIGSYGRCASAPVNVWKVVGGQHWLGLDAHAFDAIWQFLVDLAHDQ